MWQKTLHKHARTAASVLWNAVIDADMLVVSHTQTQVSYLCSWWWYNVGNLCAAKSKECLEHQMLQEQKKSSSGCRKLVCIFTWWVWIWWYWATSCSTKRVKQQCAAALQANIIWLGLVLLKATQTSYRSYQWPAWLTTITRNCNVQTSMHQYQNFSVKLAKGCIAKLF